MSEVVKGRGRPKKEIIDFVMPSTEKDITRIRDNITEAYNSMVRIAGEKDHIKSIRDLLKEELGMPPKLFNQMAKTYYKSTFSQEISEKETFEETYSKVFKTDE